MCPLSMIIFRNLNSSSYPSLNDLQEYPPQHYQLNKTQSLSTYLIVFINLMEISSFGAPLKALIRESIYYESQA